MPRAFHMGDVPLAAHAVLPEKSRALSIFVALDYHGLPLPLRWARDARWALAMPALVGIHLIAGPVTAVGVAVVGLAGLMGARYSAWSKAARERGLPLPETVRRVRCLEEMESSRAKVGLDRALPPEALEHLEPVAAQWERLENTLQAKGWDLQQPLAHRISNAASHAMEELLASEWRAIRNDSLAAAIASRTLHLSDAIRELAERAEEVTILMDSYPRQEFDSTGAPLGEGAAPVAALNRALERIESGA